MKKYLFALLGLAVFVGVLAADDHRYSPMVIESQFSDYGGYKVSVASFGCVNGSGALNFSTATVSGPGVLVEIYFSTGNIFTNDFVDVWDSTSVTFANNTSLIGRFYNSGYNVASSTLATGSVSAFRPRQFNKGLVYRPSTAVYNLITVGYYSK